MQIQATHLPAQHANLMTRNLSQQADASRPGD